MQTTSVAEGALDPPMPALVSLEGDEAPKDDDVPTGSFTLTIISKMVEPPRATSYYRTTPVKIRIGNPLLLCLKDTLTETEVRKLTHRPPIFARVIPATCAFILPTPVHTSMGLHRSWKRWKRRRRWRVLTCP